MSTSQPILKTVATLVPLEENPAAVYLAGLSSARSRVVMEQGLRVIGSWLTGQAEDQVNVLLLNWGALRYLHTAAIRARLLERYSPATANRLLSALRGVLKEAWRLEQISAEDYQRAVDIRNISGETLPAGRELTQGEILALVESCKGDKSPLIGARDAALLGILYTGGLRRAEVVGLNVEDYLPDDGKLLVKSGKGRKQRSVFVQGGAQRALDGWLRLRGAVNGPLFLPIRKSGKITLRRLSPQSVYDIVKRRATLAGLEDFSPHDFRRTFVGDMLERGVDIATVANIAGHASVDTTRRYDRRPEAVKKKAASVLYFPY
jgi:integrase/recombinase XerD